ncbi:hypothetical protein AB6A40_001797 [Gnathostoma spinigerum]|uniref:Uncharacterized protein n=1 Tax=Gnathostoma spinigerum TaxID=75299 RepID=A0ABD6EE18_9BILA
MACISVVVGHFREHCASKIIFLTSNCGTNVVMSIIKILSIFQCAAGFAAMFASSFIWNNGNVFVQFWYSGYGWQTLILTILLATWIVSFVVLFTELRGEKLEHFFGKFREMR